MVDTAKIKEHMEVLGSDGQHVGTVDKLEGQRIKLTKNDTAAPGEHRYIHVDSVASVDEVRASQPHRGAGEGRVGRRESLTTLTLRSAA